MQMTFDIPEDIRSKVTGIPGLDQRVALFLKHEAELEAIRKSRHSNKAREIVGRALGKAEEDKALGIDREESFDEFLALHRQITARL